MITLLQRCWPALIEMRLKDGTTYRASLNDVPWLQEEAVISRFRHDAAATLDPGVVEEVVRLSDMLWELEDCSALFQCFTSSSSK